MRNITSISRPAVIIACAGILSACTSVTPVKDIMADSPAYLAKKFSAASISPRVMPKLPADTLSAAPKKFSYYTESTSETTDGKKETWNSKITLTDLGNGLSQRVSENLSNDIAYSVNYSLNYRGIMDLRWQSIPLRSTMSNPLYEAKDFKRFDSFQTEVNKEFVAEYTSDQESFPAPFSYTKKVCKVLRQLPAEDIHKKLEGTGLEIECKLMSNNLVINKAKWVFLQKYNVSIQTESSAVTYKTRSKVLDVNTQTGDKL